MVRDAAYFMQHAIEAARCARAVDEVPVGAVVVYGNEIIATGFNQPIQHSDPCAHAEIMALRAAGKALGNYRLPGCTLYVTLEPCLMCAGAVMQARLSRLVFGAYDPKTGVCESVLNVFANQRLNHHTEVLGGVRGEECAQLLTHFFADKRRLAVTPCPCAS